MPNRDVLLLLALLTPAALAWSQEFPVVSDREDLALERPEGWALAYISAATLFQGFGPPTTAEPWQWRLGADIGAIPHIDTEDTRVGFDGTKFEDLNKSPVYGRVRVWLGLPAGFTAEFAWTPPVEIDGAKPDGIYSLALERPLVEQGNWRIGARLFGQSGRIEGDITCSEDVARLPPGSAGNPFGCLAPSNDEISLDHYGLELTGSMPLDAGRWEPFGSVAVTRLDAEAQVDALTFDVRDRSVRTTDGTIRTFRAGVLHRPARRWEWLVSADYTPLDVRRPPDREEENDPFWSVRLMARYLF